MIIATALGIFRLERVSLAWLRVIDLSRSQGNQRCTVLRSNYGLKDRMTMWVYRAQIKAPK